MPGDKTDSGACCFHAFNIISIQEIHAIVLQCSDSPTPLNLLFTRSLHIRPFLPARNPPNWPKDPINRFSTSSGNPMAKKHALSIHSKSHNSWTFGSPPVRQVVLLEPSLPSSNFFQLNGLCYQPSAHLTSEPAAGPADVISAWQQNMSASFLAGLFSM